MTRIHTNRIATLTDMREPHKVLERSGGKPVAIMKNPRCVSYFVPVEATLQEERRYATPDEVMDSIAHTREKTQPVLDYLKEKNSCVLLSAPLVEAIHDAVLNLGQLQGMAGE